MSITSVVRDGLVFFLHALKREKLLYEPRVERTWIGSSRKWLLARREWVYANSNSNADSSL